jgi:hypoxanthine phosphoribosyltransferase
MADFWEKLDTLSDAQLQIVVDLVDNLVATNTLPKKAKAKKVAKRRVKKSLPEPEELEEEDEDEWEILPKNRKKKKRPNKFLKMPEAEMHSDDTEWAKKHKVYKQPPVPRRPEATKVTLACSKCRKEFQVSEGLVPPGDSRVMCDKCTLSRKGG